MANRTPAIAKTRAAGSLKGKRAINPTKARGLAANGKVPVRIFISYSHKDSTVRQQLEVHLAVLKRDNVSTWFDGDLAAGDALDTNISRELRNADIFVALLSPDYLHSWYCWELEYKRAMNRRVRGAMRVVAVVVRPCDWPSTRAARFKLLPRDGRPVTRWRSADEALLDVVGGLRGVIAAFRKELSVAAVKPPRRVPASGKKNGAKRPVANKLIIKKTRKTRAAPKKVPPRKSRK